MIVLVEVERSGLVESTHTGSVVALRGDGTVALDLGELDRPMFPRSSNKPLQAVALLEAGWRPADGAELALATASHSGEPMHLAVVERMLRGRTGLLQCPPMLPLSEEAAGRLLARGGGPTALTMNCSGKHAAMIATCEVNGWPVDSYLDPQHPLQVHLRTVLERLAGEPVRAVAVDGCGAPQHALTLRGLARAFGGLAAAASGPQAQVAAAMRAHPELVGGTGRDVTLLMQGVPRLIAKDGAEGVYAAGLLDGSGVALKIHDGAARARPPVLVAALRALGVRAAILDALATAPVLGGGRPVGELRATSWLQEAVTSAA